MYTQLLLVLIFHVLIKEFIFCHVVCLWRFVYIDVCVHMCMQVYTYVQAHPERAELIYQMSSFIAFHFFYEIMFH